MRKKQMHRVGWAAAFLLSVAGCAGMRGAGPGGPWREIGLASWYGTDFHGRRTANGERYNMYAMTAAHKTLPFGTVVTVKHRRSGRKVKVRINDRGPFVSGRIIDLSYAAARALGSAAEGVAPVEITAALHGKSVVPARRQRGTSPAPDTAPALRGTFSVQVGAFTVENNAHLLRNRLAGAGTVRIVVSENRGRRWWQVRFGSYGTDAEARQAAEGLAARGYPGFVVSDD